MYTAIYSNSKFRVLTIMVGVRVSTWCPWVSLGVPGMSLSVRGNHKLRAFYTHSFIAFFMNYYVSNGILLDKILLTASICLAFSCNS